MLLLIHCLLLLPLFVLGLCFIIQYLFKVILPSRRELVALLCLPDVLWLAVSSGFSSRCCGLVCNV